MGSSTVDFDTMRAAETKRRRKKAANLAKARKGAISITAQRTHLIWTPTLQIPRLTR